MGNTEDDLNTCGRLSILVTAMLACQYYASSVSSRRLTHTEILALDTYRTWTISIRVKSIIKVVRVLKSPYKSYISYKIWFNTDSYKTNVNENNIVNNSAV